jgi:hypothetical protein
MATNNNTRKPASNKPRASRVRSVTVPPADLAQMDLSAATLTLPAHLAAALQTATAAQQQRQQTRKAPTPRVAMTAAELATLERMKWKAPYVTADLTISPKPAKRGRKACKGGAAYNAAAAILTAGQSLKVTELAALWLAAGNGPKPFNAILQQVANRAGRTIQQNGATIAAA